jgi:prepilin-type processing-associated H-X9-DG protein
MTSKSAYTLVELLTVIAIIMVVIAILLPALIQVREAAQQTVCASNLRQLGMAVEMYSADYDGALIKEFYGFPPVISSPPSNSDPNVIQSYSWRHAVQPYVKNIRVFACPTNPLATDSRYWSNGVTYTGGVGGDWIPGGYATNQDVIGFANGELHGLSSGLALDTDIPDPASTIILMDTRYNWNDAKIDWIAGNMLSGPGLPDDASYHGGVDPCGDNPLGAPGAPSCLYYDEGTFQTHQGLINFVFADGHVKPLKLAATAIPNDLWDSGYTLAQRSELVNSMLPEYR